MIERLRQGMESFKQRASLGVAAAAVGAGSLLLGACGQPAPPAVGPSIVPAARPGDMLVDPNADGLPLTYEAPAPAETVTDIAYASNDASQKLDLYLPAPKASPLPVLVWIHGGGWLVGDKTPVPEMVLRQVSRGYAVASIAYRLLKGTPSGTFANEFPAAVEDVKSAVRWLKANASTYNLNPNRIILSGESAGGHLASLVGLTPGKFEPSVTGPLAGVDSSVAGIVDLVGPLDLDKFAREYAPIPISATTHGLTEALLGCPIAQNEHTVTCTPEQLREASPDSYFSSKSPPAFLAYGTQDPLVYTSEQGLPMAKAWAEAKGEENGVWYEEVPNGSHLLTIPGLLNERAVEQFLDEVASDTLR